MFNDKEVAATLLKATEVVANESFKAGYYKSKNSLLSFMVVALGLVCAAEATEISNLKKKEKVDTVIDD